MLRDVVAVLPVLAFGPVGFGQSAPDGSAPCPTPEESIEPGEESIKPRPEPELAFVYCRQETLTVSRTPRQYYDSRYRHNRTHRCIGGIWKGCYHILSIAEPAHTTSDDAVTPGPRVISLGVGSGRDRI